MCVFVYELDNSTEPAIERQPMTFTQVYLAQVPVRRIGHDRLYTVWILSYEPLYAVVMHDLRFIDCRVEPG